MRHHILVKWKEEVPKPDIAPIEALFKPVLSSPGVYSISFHPNVIEKPNRYDLLILLCMDKEALPAYDASQAHKQWKETYGSSIAQKAIFDCE